MSLSKEKIVAITVASTFATIAVATGGAAIGSELKYGTTNLLKAMSVTKQFNNLEKSNYGKTLEQNNSFFKVVKQFIDNPRNNVLVATSVDQENGQKSVIFECLEKNRPDAKKDNSKDQCYN